MSSKTPQFDKAIEEILQGLKPHQKTCPQCGSVFDIYQEDIEFYKKMKVPPPTLCPQCRLQRRLGHRLNVLPIFYKKTCSAPGHSEKIISFYSEKNPRKVYDNKYYVSDKWDALEFGRDYDFSKLFFEQFHQLALVVPHQALQHDLQSVNCDYVVGGISSRDCYYVGVPYRSENIYYSSLPIRCKDCLDINDTDNSEQCYENVSSDRCYNCNFCYESRNCLDSYFLYDCRNCQHCFGCTNLRNKKYYFFNQPLGKEDYQRKLKEINLGSRKVLKKYQAKFAKLFQRAIRRGVNNVKSVDCLGDLLKNCRDCFYCFQVFGGAENSRYLFHADKVTDMMDIFGTAKSSLCYESTGISPCSRIKFSRNLKGGGMDLEYCAECSSNCQYCFGCFGLKNKRYCIFNKQYSENEYWQLLDKIKTQMLKRGEYGEFFPLSISRFPYQDSTASIEFSLTKEQILKNNWHWQDEQESELDLSKFQVLKPEQVPDDIKDVKDDILDKVILCEQTGKPFRIMPFELKFYRQKNLPLPTIHPLQRIRNRFAFRRHWRLWQVPCAKCGKITPTSFDPQDNFKIFCEPCYLKEVV